MIKNVFSAECKAELLFPKY